MKGPGEDFSMSHLPFLSARFPVGFGVWHDLSECTRLDLTVVLISNDNISICSYYPEGISLPFLLQAGHVFDVVALSRIRHKRTR